MAEALGVLIKDGLSSGAGKKTYPGYELLDCIVPLNEGIRAYRSAKDKWARAKAAGASVVEPHVERRVSNNWARAANRVIHEEAVAEARERLRQSVPNGNESIVDIIRGRIMDCKAVINRMLREKAHNVAESRDAWLRKQNYSEAFDPWASSGFGFVFDPGFRQSFEDASMADGLVPDFLNFWRGVDLYCNELPRRLSVYEGDIAGYESEVFETLADLTVMFLVASLEGARNLVEDLGASLGDTPVPLGPCQDGPSGTPIVEVQKREASTRADAVDAQLVGIVFTGRRVSDYYVQSDLKGRPRVYPIASDEQGALFGVDQTWGSLEKWGRFSWLSVPVGSVSVSHHHCVIMRQSDGRWALSDVGSSYTLGDRERQGSTAGTLLVRGEHAQFLKGDSRILENGDIICLAPVSGLTGDGELRYRWMEGALDMCFRFELVRRADEYRVTSMVTRKNSQGDYRSYVTKSHPWTGIDEEGVKYGV